MGSGKLPKYQYDKCTNANSKMSVSTFSPHRGVWRTSTGHEKDQSTGISLVNKCLNMVSTPGATTNLLPERKLESELAKSKGSSLNPPKVFMNCQSALRSTGESIVAGAPNPLLMCVVAERGTTTTNQVTRKTVNPIQRHNPQFATKDTSRLQYYGLSIPVLAGTAKKTHTPVVFPSLARSPRISALTPLTLSRDGRKGRGNKASEAHSRVQHGNKARNSLTYRFMERRHVSLADHQTCVVLESGKAHAPNRDGGRKTSSLDRCWPSFLHAPTLLLPPLKVPQEPEPACHPVVDRPQASQPIRPPQESTSLVQKADRVLDPSVLVFAPDKQLRKY
jgi:hypothetical protein